MGKPKNPPKMATTCEIKSSLNNHGDFDTLDRQLV